uniref:SNRPN upstream reading frame protein isoform X1 n=1 Tax=Nyctereutes procyonoides TaxID=34880 RepID=UPI002443C4A4|nr:SNRPN upstream reading frame protein isoform X1 [Nyctereutes procyonoides]XP_055182670.1 SNRPN upstream reading frame protein isoform X1 [Nyctereutes procyonoides]XP_055182671.1 SNRPN upstream reading frame protein isoform X1 [Nyctereutes procyonoides]XP_055182672.1 SNRPN upstream reading frame protein isoform X1 [Nyctereutes procyonoides]XP_055182673.1 SNRPN upstream reading frame protein isoform X1 [Nyctereutes procyonoides]
MERARIEITMSNANYLVHIRKCQRLHHFIFPLPVSPPPPPLLRDRLHLRRTTEQHVPEVEVQVKRRRTASLSNQECQLYPRRSQQQQVPVVDFQAELRQAFLAETPRGG